MNKELLHEIRKYINNNFNELSNEDAQKAIDKTASKFVNDRTIIWWWEGLTHESVSLNYGDSDGLILLKEIVGDNDKDVMLFVTDDESEPWPVFQGRLGRVIEVIAEQSFFEYFIAGKEFSWLIFDTHHNSLVVSGSLVEVAKNKLEKLSRGDYYDKR